MRDEIQSLLNNDTFEEVLLPRALGDKVKIGLQEEERRWDARQIQSSTCC